MEHTKFLNKINEEPNYYTVRIEDHISKTYKPAQVDDWIRKNILSKGDRVPLTTSLNKDQSVCGLEFGIKLTEKQKEYLIKKFPELEGKEIE